MSRKQRLLTPNLVDGMRTSELKLLDRAFRSPKAPATLSRPLFYSATHSSPTRFLYLQTLVAFGTLLQRTQTTPSSPSFAYKPSSAAPTKAPATTVADNPESTVTLFPVLKNTAISPHGTYPSYVIARVNSKKWRLSWTLMITQSHG
jgi:hypothetical protein